MIKQLIITLGKSANENLNRSASLLYGTNLLLFVLLFALNSITLCLSCIHNVINNSAYATLVFILLGISLILALVGSFHSHLMLKHQTANYKNLNAAFFENFFPALFNETTSAEILPPAFNELLNYQIREEYLTKQLKKTDGIMYSCFLFFLMGIISLVLISLKLF